EKYETILSPILLKAEIPLTEEAEAFIEGIRDTCSKIISGEDDRLLVVVGPCSIHDPKQALEYAHKLKASVAMFPDLVILMRAYFEKPRTTVGWKGLINDPDLNGTCDINKGLYTARKLLRDLTEVGLPLAVELLDTISPQYLSDFISWGAIGARTTESQLHRELASGSKHPVGFKNGTDGGIGVAVDAMKSASSAHSFIGVSDQGSASIVKTKGNKDVHVVLRGGKSGPNYSNSFVTEAGKTLLKQRSSEHPAIMIDCSHGNSQKDHRNQPKVVEDICSQLRDGNAAIIGVMIESNVNEGRQDIPKEGPEGLKHGISITDACIDLQTTIKTLKSLQSSVVERRSTRKQDEVNASGGLLDSQELSKNLPKYSIPSVNLIKN
ncbi:3-deoxy-7-phosphoheptulonate synthase, partial [Phakopsora pachyrhizi]